MDGRLALLLGTLGTIMDAGDGTVTCQSYSCSIIPFTNGTCVAHFNNSNSLYPCSSPKSYCPPDFSGSFSTCQLPLSPPPASPPYIGEPCNSSPPCVTGTCVSTHCRGLPFGSPCVSHSDCDISLRCSKAHCDFLMEVGDWGCLIDQDCVVNAGCNLIKGRFEGTCTMYASLFPGAVVSDCVDGRSNMCGSSYCRQGQETLFPKHYCIDAPQSSSPLPTICSHNSDCVGLSRPWTVSGQCSCGYNAGAKAYCSVHVGDPPGQALLQALVSILTTGDAKQCHTERRLTRECLKAMNETGYAEWETRETYFRRYAELQGNDKCVRDIYTRFYWSAGRVNAVGIAVLAFTYW